MCDNATANTGGSDPPVLAHQNICPGWSLDWHVFSDLGRKERWLFTALDAGDLPQLDYAANAITHHPRIMVARGIFVAVMLQQINDAFAGVLFAGEGSHFKIPLDWWAGDAKRRTSNASPAVTLALMTVYKGVCND